jgi:hypothetical protein
VPGSESRLKKIANASLGLLIPVGFIILLFLFAVTIRGMVWASDKALPWLVAAGWIAIAICLFVLSPLCIFRKTRPWAGIGFAYASLVFGLELWAYSCLFVVYKWGYVGLGIGLLFAGVGVVPMAFVAAILHAEWSALLEIVLGLCLTFGTRYLGMRLTEIRPEEELLPEE